MVSIFKKKEIEVQSNVEEEPTVVLRRLETEETCLMEERRELLAFKEKLLLKAEEKIEIMKRMIQTLKNELSELRHQCEELEIAVSHQN